MIPVPDICDTPLEAERAALPRCAEHRTRLMHSAMRRRSVTTATSPAPTAARRGRLRHAVQLLRRILRPAHT